MGKAFEMIKEGLEDAIAYAQGDLSRGRVANPSDAGGGATMTIMTTPLDAAKYFPDEEAQIDLITDALASGDAGYIAAALGTVAKARKFAGEVK